MYLQYKYRKFTLSKEISTKMYVQAMFSSVFLGQDHFLEPSSKLIVSRRLCITHHSASSHAPSHSTKQLLTAPSPQLVTLTLLHLC